MSEAPRYRRTEGVWMSEVGGQKVLVGSKIGELYVLKGVGDLVWEALAEPGTAASIAAAVSECCAGAGDQAGPEVDAFLAELVRLGLVQAEPDRPV